MANKVKFEIKGFDKAEIDKAVEETIAYHNAVKDIKDLNTIKDHGKSEKHKALMNKFRSILDGIE